MPSADLYLLPTNSESFGLSALEAQACGVPVLGYDVGGLPEVVENGRDGFPARRSATSAGLADDGAVASPGRGALPDDVGGGARPRRAASSTRTRSSRATSPCTSGSSRRPDARSAHRPRARGPSAPHAATRRYSARSVVPKRPGSSVESVTGTPAARSARTGCDGAPGDGARRDVGRRTDVEDDAAPRERAEKRGILGRADAVREPDGAEPLERLGDGIRSRPLACVRDGHEAEPARAAEGVGEIPRGEGRLLAAESEPHGTRPRAPRVQVEDALGRRRAPVPDDVEEDEDPAVSRRFVPREDRLERLADGEPVEAEPLDDGGGDVDLGVADPLAAEARRRGRGRRGRSPSRCGSGGRRRGRSRRTRPASRGRDGGRARTRDPGKWARGAAGGEAHERRGRDRALEVQVELDGGRGGESAQERGGGRGEAHASGSYGVFETGPVPLGAPPRERLWMRAAAFGVDVLLLAGGPFLVSSRDRPRDPRRRCPRRRRASTTGFRAAQALAGLLFLFRDAAGGSPGKRLFGLRLVRPGGVAGGACGLARAQPPAPRAGLESR